jgi:hypothetical protein
VTVGSNDPSGAERSVREVHSVPFDAGHRRLPEELHTTFFGSGEQALVKHRTPQADCVALRKISNYGCILLHKRNATETMSIAGLKLNSELIQDGQRLRHHSFATSFVYGRSHAVQHGYIETFLTSGNGRRQPSRPAANNQYVQTIC